MKVFMLRNPASHMGCSLKEKETGMVSEQVGKVLLAAGVAVLIAEPEPVIVAVPPTPEITVVAAPVVEAIPEPPAVSVATKPEIAVTSTPEPLPVAVTSPRETISPKPATVWPAKGPVLPVRKIKHKES